MGTKYTTILSGGVVSTYNDNPPSDDGAQTEANRVKFATITSDLTAPLHSAIIDIDEKLLDLVDEGPLTKAGTYTTQATDYAKTIEASGTFTLSLLAPSGQAGYKVRVKNAGSGTVTVDVSGGGNIDGESSHVLRPNEGATYRVNAAATAYLIEGNVGESFDSGTKMVFMQAAAPTGWTIDATFDNRAFLFAGSYTPDGGTITTLASDIAGGATALTVASITGFSDGDPIRVDLDDGTFHISTVDGTPAGSTIDIDDALPGTGTVATLGNSVYLMEAKAGADTGGLDDPALMDAVPVHSHSFNDPGHTHNTLASSTAVFAQGGAITVPGFTVTASSSSVTNITISNNIGSNWTPKYACGICASKD